MILEIRLSNFFSIKDEIVLDMRAGNTKSQQVRELGDNVFTYKNGNVLKAIAIYGANASGKSNIIKAIRFCCSVILQSHLNNENVVFLFTPFKFEGYHKKPSTFEIRFVMNGVEYDYSYSLQKTGILTESLFYYPNNRRAKVFVRDEMISGEKKDKYSFGYGIKRPLDVAANTSNKTLYISRASQMDREFGKEVFRFFNDQFLLGYTGLNAPNIESLIADNKESLITALQIADSDIVDIKTKKRTVPLKSVNVSLPAATATVNDVEEEMIQVITNHKAAPGIAFDLVTEESAGTRNLFLILLSLFDIIKKNKILLIDEIELSLHIRIVEFIIKFFYISKSAQLIFTTHNTKLLDLEKFRRDQIYFVNKMSNGSSDLYSLFDYKDFRDTMDVEKAYLQGRFDAIPFMDDSISNLKSLINGR